MRQPVTELTKAIRTVEKISLDSPGIVGEVADFDTSLTHTIESVMKLVALRNSNSNNAQSAQNLCGVIERSG